jgi:hypothetical protein
MILDMCVGETNTKRSLVSRCGGEAMSADGLCQPEWRELVPQSVLDAIRSGDWDFEPMDEINSQVFPSTDAMPGSEKKLAVLAERIKAGLPLWHPGDRLSYDEAETAETG